TMERQNLIGSAFKRRALVNLAAGRSEAVVRGDLLRMKKAYAEARRIGTREPSADLFYSASNLIASDIALDRSGSKALRLDPDVVAQFKASVEARAKQDADFWSVVAGIELDQYQTMADRTLADDSNGLLARYRHLHERVKSPR